MSTPEQITSLVREAFAGQTGEFRACAYFDDSLDCIRVIARDCSITETRINSMITVLEATRGGTKCVGFTLKGARYFCKEHRLNLNTPITVSQLFDAIMAASPDLVVATFVDHVLRPLVREEGIERVEVSEAVSDLTPQTA
jgi:hypothetical protein